MRGALDLLGDFSGQRVTVLGSAPSPVLPEGWEQRPLVCVNGSQAMLAPEIAPDVLLFVGCSLRPTDKVGAATMRAIAGRSARRLIYVEACKPWREGSARLARLPFTWSEHAILSLAERAAILGRFLGEPVAADAAGPVRVPSNGVLAALMCVLAGCVVDVSGVSFATGHALLRGDAPRLHIEMDRKVVAVLLAQSAPVRFHPAPPI